MSMIPSCLTSHGRKHSNHHIDGNIPLSVPSWPLSIPLRQLFAIIIHSVMAIICHYTFHYGHYPIHYSFHYNHYPFHYNHYFHYGHNYMAISSPLHSSYTCTCEGVLIPLLVSNRISEGYSSTSLPLTGYSQ